MRWRLKSELFPLSVLLAILISAAFFFPILPERLATPFQAGGKPASWDKALVFALGLGGCGLFYLAATFFPRIGPWRHKVEPHYDSYLKQRNLTLFFLGIVFFTYLYAVRSNRFELHWLGFAFGLLFVASGIHLRHLPVNPFIGIRSYWTRASAEIWRKTHNLSANVCVSSGLLMIALAWRQVNLAWIVCGVLLPVVQFCYFLYPYLLYRKMEKAKR